MARASKFDLANDIWKHWKLKPHLQWRVERRSTSTLDHFKLVLKMLWLDKTFDRSLEKWSVEWLISSPDAYRTGASREY